MIYDSKATCRECDGDGCIWNNADRTSGQSIECAHCAGEGECGCDDCISDAAEAAYERRCEDFYGGSSPMTMDEQHRAAWAQKQELRR